MLKLLQYIDQLPLEKPEGTKVFNVLYFTCHWFNCGNRTKSNVQCVMKCVFPVFEGTSF